MDKNNIVLNYNYGYRWVSSEKIFFKGYFIVDDILYRDDEAIEYINGAKDYIDFCNLVKKIDGIFCIIFNNEKLGEKWVAVDISRSFPIYMSQSSSYISDDINKLVEITNLNKEDINFKNAFSILSSRFCMFNNTVYSDILQLDMGQTCLIKDNGNIEINYYYRHVSNNIKNYKDEIHIKNDYKEILDKIFERIILATKERQIVLSLSGGYDSTHVAYMLKKKNIKNVVCYSYGKRNSPDAIKSAQTAEKLGYKLIFIEHTDELMKTMIDENFYKYLDFSNKGDNITYLQNYLAVRELCKKNIISEDAVFLTGLCGDMPSGNYLMNLDNYNNISISCESLANVIYDELYHRYITNDKIKNKIISELTKEIERMGIEIINLETYIKVKDCIMTGSSHNRVFLNMNNVHEFFGHEFLLPLWDKEFLKFWYELPLEFRVEQNFYEKFILESINKEYGIVIAKKARSINSWSIKKNQLKVKIKYAFGGIATRIFYRLSIPLRRKSDINNFAYPAVDIYNKIKYKGLINYSKANFDLLCSMHIFEYKYGNQVLIKLKKFIK